MNASIYLQNKYHHICTYIYIFFNQRFPLLIEGCLMSSVCSRESFLLIITSRHRESRTSAEFTSTRRCCCCTSVQHACKYGRLDFIFNSLPFGSAQKGFTFCLAWIFKLAMSDGSKNTQQNQITVFNDLSEYSVVTPIQSCFPLAKKSNQITSIIELITVSAVQIIVRHHVPDFLHRWMGISLNGDGHGRW